MNSGPYEPRLISGKLAISVALTVSLLGVGFAWQYYRVLQRRSLEYWSPAKADIIMHAERVEALRLEPAPGDQGLPDEQVLRAGDSVFRIAEIRPATQARGLVHVRHALINGATFTDFFDARDVIDWQYALRFHGEGQAVTVLFECRNHLVALPEKETVASVKTAAGAAGRSKDPFLDFLREQFPQRADR